MGMGNRQGSGHDVEDESGSLDQQQQQQQVVQSSSGQQNTTKFGFKFGSTQKHSNEDYIIANNQSDE